MSRNGARWLRAKVRSRPSAVTCRVFQYPPTLLTSTSIRGRRSQDLVGQSSHLGLGGQVRDEGVHPAPGGCPDLASRGVGAVGVTAGDRQMCAHRGQARWRSPCRSLPVAPVTSTVRPVIGPVIGVILLLLGSWRVRCGFLTAPQAGVLTGSSGGVVAGPSAGPVGGLVRALVEAERRVLVAHQGDVGQHPVDPAVDADDDVEQRARVAAGEQQDEAGDEDQDAEQRDPGGCLVAGAPVVPGGPPQGHVGGDQGDDDQLRDGQQPRLDQDQSAGEVFGVVDVEVGGVVGPGQRERWVPVGADGAGGVERRPASSTAARRR